MPKEAQTNAWQPLEAGDSVAVVNVCMIDRDAEFHKGAYEDLLEKQLGYKVNGLEKLKAEKPYLLWSATPQERAQILIDAIRNEDNKAIFLLVGGDGANEVLKLVFEEHKRNPLPKRGIPVIGLSNNTTILNPLAQLGIISPIQGKLDAAIALKLYSKEEIEASENPQEKAKKEQENIERASKNIIIEQNAAALRRLLSGQDSSLEFQVEPINEVAKLQLQSKETLEGEIVGGCNFHVIESARTAFAVDAGAKYLAIEGPEEQCSLTETLEALKREGMLEGVKAIFCGHIAGFKHQANETPAEKARVEAKRAAIEFAAGELAIPIYVGLPWGHIRVGAESDVYLPLSTNAALTQGEDGFAKLTVDRFRSAENLNAVYLAGVKAVENKGVPQENNPIIVAMETMLQDPNHPNLEGKDVILAFTPKYGEPISHMMGVSQSLAALLHKGNLANLKSLTLDLSGLYDERDGSSIYRTLDGRPLNPPHLYNNQPIKEVIANRESYAKEMELFLANFSELHLGGVKTAVSDAALVSEIAAKVNLTPNQLNELYQLNDGSGRVDASSMAKDFENGKGVEKIQEKQKKFEIDKEHDADLSRASGDNRREEESWTDRVSGKGSKSVGVTI
jgi:muramoyltetrapeptide carboxypeptidase LdcA involved in peptidoglycan recycling